MIENTDLYKLENERDLDYIDCVYTELESLLIDQSGIDYEKILQDINVEGLIKGISVTTPSSAPITPGIAQKSGFDTYTQSILDTNKHQQVKIEEQIATLEKQSVLMNDRRKRIETEYRINKLREELEEINFSVRIKAYKKYYMDLVKVSYNMSQQSTTGKTK
jgi:hypothetical protein